MYRFPQPWVRLHHFFELLVSRTLCGESTTRTRVIDDELQPLRRHSDSGSEFPPKSGGPGPIIEEGRQIVGQA